MTGNSLPFLLLFFAGSERAFAWEPLYVCPVSDEQTWEDTQIDVAIGANSITSVSQRDAIEAAVESWDGDVVGHVDMDAFTHLDFVTSTFDNNDDVNFIAGSTAFFDPGVLAFAELRGETCLLSTQELVEVDIHVNPLLTWDTPSEYYDFCDAPFAAETFFLDDTARHEVGHGLGFAHVGYNNPAAPGTHLATMFQTYSGAMVIGEREYIGDRPHFVSEDDREGMRSFYGDVLPTVVDVAAQSYFYNEEALDPSECPVPSRPSPATNDLTQLAVDNGLPLGSCPIDPVTAQCVATTAPPAALNVVPGNSILVDFTFANLGVASQTPEARIILTAENDPTPTGYVVLHTFNPVINPNTPFDDEFLVTIPTVTEGLYYIILQLDYNGTLVEDEEGNNEAFWNRQVYVDSDWGGCAECATGPSPSAAWVPLLLVGVLAHRRRGRA